LYAIQWISTKKAGRAMIRFCLPVYLSLSLCSCSNSTKEVIGDQAEAVRELPVVAVQSKILDRVDQIPG